jgi:hypothetical protein
MREARLCFAHTLLLAFIFAILIAIDFHAAAILHCRDLPPRHADTFILRDAAATLRLVFEPSAIAGFRRRFAMPIGCSMPRSDYAVQRATPPLMRFLRRCFKTPQIHFRCHALRAIMPAFSPSFTPPPRQTILFASFLMHHHFRWPPPSSFYDDTIDIDYADSSLFRYFAITIDATFRSRLSRGRLPRFPLLLLALLQRACACSSGSAREECSMRGASAYAHAQAQQQHAECEKGRDLRAISAAVFDAAFTPFDAITPPPFSLRQTPIFAADFQIISSRYVISPYR